MRKLLKVMVLLALIQVVTAGPIAEQAKIASLEPQPQNEPGSTFENNGLTTYAAFLALAGPRWFLGTPTPAKFDPIMPYGMDGETQPAVIDPEAEFSSPVPEPRSLAILGLGLLILALLGIRRRRRTHSHNL